VPPSRPTTTIPKHQIAMHSSPQIRQRVIIWGARSGQEQLPPFPAATHKCMAHHSVRLGWGSGVVCFEWAGGTLVCTKRIRGGVTNQALY